MQRVILKSKVHRATVTDADLEYEGSLTLDRDLMDAADLISFEQVHVYNVTNGERFETYIMDGERGSGTICVNGAAARRASIGDKIIIASYAVMDTREAKGYQPKIIVVDGKNHPAFTAVKGKLKPLGEKKGKKKESWFLDS